MRKIGQKQMHAGALDILERATTLLRNLPASAWLVQAAGTVLFIGAFLHFVADMGGAADAKRRLVPAALGLACAYAAMKYCHALFGSAMLDFLKGGRGSLPRLTVGEHFRLFAGQTFIHSTSPWVNALSMLAVVPSAWTHATYHNATLMAVDAVRAKESTSTLIGRALKASHHSPRQNHALLISILLIGLLVGLNMFALAMVLPYLAKMLSGSENALTLNPMATLNSTLITAVIFATWLVINPLSRACYALRCFHFVSIRNGDDLRAELLRLPAIATLAIVAFFALTSPARALETSTPPANTPAIESFDEAMDDVLSKPEFRWRLPRIETLEEKEKSWFEQMVIDSAKWLGEQIDSMMDSIGKFIRWLFKTDRDPFRHRGDGPSFVGSSDVARVLVWLLLGLGGCALTYLGIRWWLRQRKAQQRTAAVPVPIAVDLFDESVTADALPEDEWLRLAQEKWAAGDHRLAIRALFLGTLARLGENGWLAIAAGKTNGMYVRELKRQSRASGEMNHAFHDNVNGYEATWYGDHPVDDSTFQRFTLNLETIRRHALTP